MQPLPRIIIVFEGPGPPILSHVGTLFSDPLPEVTFARLLSILEFPGLPFGSPWALFFDTQKTARKQVTQGYAKLSGRGRPGGGVP